MDTSFIRCGPRWALAAIPLLILGVIISTTMAAAQSTFEIPQKGKEWHRQGRLITSQLPAELTDVWLLARAESITPDLRDELMNAAAFGAPPVKINAIIALGNPACADPLVIGQLVDFTRDDHPEYACAAAYSLGRLVESGARDERIIPALARLSLRDYPCNDAGTEVLHRIAQTGDEQLRAELTTVVAEAMITAERQLFMVHRFRVLGPELAEYLCQIAETDPNDPNRLRALEVMEKVGSLGQYVEPRLIALLDDPDVGIQASEVLQWTTIRDPDGLAEWQVGALEEVNQRYSTPVVQRWPIWHPVQLPEAVAPVAPVEFRDDQQVKIVVGQLERCVNAFRGREDVITALIHCSLSDHSELSRISLYQLKYGVIDRETGVDGAEQVLSALAPALDSGIPSVRLRATEVLSELLAAEHDHYRAEVYIERLIDLLLDDSLTVRRAALAGIEKDLPTSAQATRLAETAQSSDQNVELRDRITVLADSYPHALPGYLVDPLDYEPPLSGQLNCLDRAISDPGCNSRCLEAHLDRITDRQAATACLVARLADDDPECCVRACQGLRFLGPDAQSALPALIRRFDDRNDKVRLYAAAAASGSGPVAVPRLAALSTDLSPLARKTAVYCLGQYYREYPGEVIPALEVFLEDSDPKVRSDAATWLRFLGPEAVVAASELGRLSCDPYQEPEHGFYVARSACLALYELQQDGVPYLAAGLACGEREVYHDILQTVSNSDWDTAALTPQLVPLTGAGIDQTCRGHAIRSLGKTSVVGPEVVGTLCGLLNTADSKVNRYAAVALARLAWLPADYCAAAVKD